MEKIKIIIVEGADGTGKSTFAQELAEKNNLKYVHIDGKHPNTYSAYATHLCDLVGEVNVSGKYKGIVFDRSWYGELVYGPVYREHSRIQPEDIVRIEFLIKEVFKADLTKYLCVNDTYNKLKVYSERGEEEASHDEKDIADIAERFMMIMSDNRFHDTIITRRF